MPYDDIISFELVPPINDGISLLENIVNRLSKYVKTFNIVDTPFGTPRPSSPIIASFLKAKYEEIEFIPHVKIVNTNKVGLYSILLALKSLHVKKVLVVSGDRPKNDVFINTLKPERLVSEIKRDEGFKDIKIGIGLGKNLTYKYLRDKLISNPDFIVTQPFTTVKEIIDFKEKYTSICRKYNISPKIYATYIVPSEKNKVVFSSLNIDYKVFASNSELILQKLLDEFNGIFFSSPLDIDSAMIILKKVIEDIGEKALC